MRKCTICHDQPNPAGLWTWQPFGPGEDANLFTAPGCHYRGFPAFAVCDTCRQAIIAGQPVTIKYKGQLITLNQEAQP